ncbi:MAG TPA: DUF4142 domain-containing protein [Flavipsychrobacter sp.]|nr:DUF4142 domain-containing protein [Flavipsychrobacter sp.]
MKTRKLSLSILFGLLTALTACENHPEDTKEMAEEANEQKFDKPMEKDADFVTTAANGGMMEVKLGELASSKASSKKVKDFAAMMVTDHSKANDELKAIATQKNISLPSSLSNDMQDKYNELNSKTGSEFDRAYISYMVKDHKEDIDLFKQEAEKGNDSDLKNWASGKIPVLEHHLHMAEQADSTLDK